MGVSASCTFFTEDEMTWERKPQTESTWIARMLEQLTRLAVGFPMLTLIIAVAAAAGSLWLTTHKLGFRTSRAELLDPNSDFNRRWLDYTKDFGDKEDVVVVVEGETPQITAEAIDDVCKSLAQRKDLFGDVFHYADAPKLRDKGLYYLNIEPKKDSPDELTLKGIDMLLERASPILQGNWPQLSLGGMARQMDAAMAGGPQAQQQLMAAMKDELPQMLTALQAAITPGGEYKSPWPVMKLPGNLAAESASSRLISRDGRTGFILLRFLEEDKQGFAQNEESINVLKKLTADVCARHQNTKIGLTGLPIIEHDEMKSSEASMSVATFVSFAGVLAVIIIAFGGFRHGTMAMITLVIAMIWACGMTTLTIGHINVLSIAFGSILFGLGIDYGIYYCTRYLELRRMTDSTTEALAATAASVGPGVLTGAITSALAFFAAGFTKFPGVSQLGIIAGSGVLLCWLGEAFVLPAMIRLTDPDGPPRRLPTPLDLRVWLRPIFAYPRSSLLLLVLGTIVTGVGLGYLEFNYNLLDMQPEGLESVELEHKLFQRLDRSAWFAISVADSPEELLARKKKFLKLPSVDRVEEVVSKLPKDCEMKRTTIEKIHQRLVQAKLPAKASDIPDIPVTSQADLLKLFGGAQMMVASMPEMAQATAGLQQLSEAIKNMPPAAYEQMIGKYQQAMAADLLKQMQSLLAASSPGLPAFSDLPDSVVSRFISKNGRRYAMQVYSKENIWEVGPMGEFVKDIRTVDKDATGNPMQVYEASWLLKKSFELAAVYALGMIVLAVLFDFRRLNLTLLAMLPMGFGLFQTLGLMGLLGIQLNQANMIVLPLTIGIGMEGGINLVHEMRCHRGRYRGPGNPVIVAIVVNALTTMVGFGALMIANHRGLQSLGRVLTISMGCCLLSSLLLPNLLVIGRFDKITDEITDKYKRNIAKSWKLALVGLLLGFSQDIAAKLNFISHRTPFTGMIVGLTGLLIVTFALLYAVQAIKESDRIGAVVCLILSILIAIVCITNISLCIIAL
jgi:uncharacterized protein